MDYEIVKGSKREYKRTPANIGGTCFHVDTDERVMEILVEYMHKRRYIDNPPRLRLYYGDTETGRDWEEVYDVTGYIGRSTGKFKIPILLHNTRSMGGGAILDHCIVKIAHANKRNGGVIYFHPKYHIAQGDDDGSQ